MKGGINYVRWISKVESCWRIVNWHRDIDDLFGRFFPRHESENSVNNWTPRMETYRKDSDYVVRVDLPGVDPRDVQVEAEGNLLSITGEWKG